MRSRILAEEYTRCATPAEEAHKREWLQTRDVARLLERTTRGVLWLAYERRLPGKRTRSGQWIFQAGDVARVMKEREAERAQSRRARLRAVRVRMLKAPSEPRQLWLLRPRKGERSLPDREAQHPHLVRKSA